jgi:predicted permease
MRNDVGNASSCMGHSLHSLPKPFPTGRSWSRVITTIIVFFFRAIIVLTQGDNIYLPLFFLVIISTMLMGHAVAKLVEVLCYKPEDRRFDYR